MKTNLSDLTTIIKEAGLKATQQRLVILSALYENQMHPSCEDLYEIVRHTNPSISLGTIYKTLESFNEAGLISMVATSEGLMRYDGNTGTHNHVYVTNTKEILDFEDKDLLEHLESYLGKKKFKNFNINKIRLHIEGEKIDIEKDIKIN